MYFWCTDHSEIILFGAIWWRYISACVSRRCQDRRGCKWCMAGYMAGYTGTNVAMAAHRRVGPLDILDQIYWHRYTGTG